MRELRKLTRHLVEIPSHEDAGPAGDRIERWLRSKTDAVVDRDEVGNVLAWRRSDSSPTGDPSGCASLALVGHHDVVPPDESQVSDDGFVATVADGRLYGRGSADMKGAVAAVMLAFRDADLSVSDPNGSVDLAFASFVGEEIGGVGARHAIESGFAPDYAVVGEGSTGYSAPDTTDIAVAHKGRKATTVVAEGQSVHASVPEDGTNAIYRACEVVDELRSLPVPSVDVAGEELQGSLAVTEIAGGSAWNVVPGRCSVTVDERTVPGERISFDAIAEREGVTVTVDQDLPPMRCEDESFVELALDAARTAQAETEREPERVVKPHATDAGWLAGAGTECVVCGPSEPGEAHTADESVSLPVLDRCYRIYRTIAEQFPPS